MYRLGLELRANTGRISPDISTLSGVSAASTASTASLNSLSSSDALLDLGRLSQLFPGLATRDRDDTKLEMDAYFEAGYEDEYQEEYIPYQVP